MELGIPTLLMKRNRSRIWNHFLRSYLKPIGPDSTFKNSALKFLLGGPDRLPMLCVEPARPQPVQELKQNLVVETCSFPVKTQVLNN